MLFIAVCIIMRCEYRAIPSFGRFRNRWLKAGQTEDGAAKLDLL